METPAAPDTKPARAGMFTGLAPRSTAPVSNRTARSFLVGAVLGLVLVGGYTGYQHFNVEPAEERAAFKTVTESTSEELRGKSVDELVDLGSKVHRFGVHVPGMMLPSVTASVRVDFALDHKQGRH